jgi:hypothetical protein
MVRFARRRYRESRGPDVAPRVARPVQGIKEYVMKFKATQRDERLRSSV